MLPADFANRFRTEFPDAVGGQVVVAYSGGADSTALLHLLHSAALGLSLCAVHVHHHHRGAEADGDAEHCQRQCERLSIPFQVVHLTPEAHPPEGREGGWRRLRYEALERVRQQRAAAVVATGHHADDIVESVLVGLLRGGGPRSLAGIASRCRGGTVVRPLLHWSRAQLAAWLREQRIPWRDDDTNLDPEHLRNRIRHEVLPVLEQVSPSIRRQLVALASVLAEDEATLADLAAEAGHLDPWHPDGGVPVAMVRSLAPAARRRWLPAQTSHNGVGPVTRPQLDDLDRLLDVGRPRSVTLAGRWRIVRAGRTVWLEPPTPPPPWELRIAVGQTLALPLPGWFVQMRHAEDPAPTEPVFDQIRTESSAVTLRSPRSTDTVVMEGRARPLREVLRRRLPRHLRSSWPAVCEGDTLRWIPGVVSDRNRSCAGGGNVVEVIYR
jgi:tRNA(Ile)-lysidine synthase